MIEPLAIAPFYPKTNTIIHTHSTKWFGGRITSGQNLKYMLVNLLVMVLNLKISD